MWSKWPSWWGEAKPNQLAVYQEHRYRYDRWGTCIERKSGAHDVRTFRWDAQHQLERAHITRVERGHLITEHWGYDYDPFGRRIAKYRLPADEAANASSYAAHATAQRKRTASATDRARHDTGTTHFAWDGNRLLLERSNAQQTLTLYEPGSFVPLALVRNRTDVVAPAAERSPLPLEVQSLKDSHPNEWAAADERRKKLQQRLDAQLGVGETSEPSRPKADVFYVHADHLGTPRELTDSEGHLIWTANYKAWGAATVETPPRRALHAVGNTQTETWEDQSDPITQNLRFQGQYFDAETGLHYNRFRYYDADVGRFVSQDPIGLYGGTNSYQYAPNPVGWIDSLGLSPCAPKINLKHIFHGETNRRGRPTGFHHQGSIGHGDSAIVTQRGAANTHGVYSANVGVLNPATGVYQTKASTMFPDAWSRVRTLDEIRSAYRDAVNKGAVSGNKLKGLSCSGVEIEGYLDAAGDINTAYQKM